MQEHSCKIFCTNSLKSKSCEYCTYVSSNLFATRLISTDTVSINPEKFVQPN